MSYPGKRRRTDTGWAGGGSGEDGLAGSAPSRRTEYRKDPDGLGIVIHRSPRRKLTVEARVVGGELHAYLPAGMSEAEERKWLSRMKHRLRHKLSSDNDDLVAYLEARARKLNDRYFGGELSWKAIKVTRARKWVFGSCDSSRKEIRISEEIRHLPTWVQDYLLLHELAHLIYPDHGKKFWEVVRRYEKADRADGYLLGWAQRKELDKAAARASSRKGERTRLGCAR